jgi:hypothetical protein
VAGRKTIVRGASMALLVSPAFAFSPTIGLFAVMVPVLLAVIGLTLAGKAARGIERGPDARAGGFTRQRQPAGIKAG